MQQNILTGFSDTGLHSKFVILLKRQCELRRDDSKMTNTAVPVYTKRGQY